MSIDINNNDISMVNMATIIEFLNATNFSQDEYTPFSWNTDLAVRSDISTDSGLDLSPSQYTEIRSCDPAYFPPSLDSDGSDRDDSSIILEDTQNLLGNDWTSYNYELSRRDFLNYHQNQSYHCTNLNSSDDIYIKQEIKEELMDCPETSVDNNSRLPSFEKLASSCRISKSMSSVTRSPDYDSEDNDIDFQKKKKRGAKNILLWKFLLTELRSDSQAVRWVDQKQGTFRFTDTVEVSKKWGQKKQKTDMNFEKLSRGIRHYYKNKFMTRMDGVRLVYKFNWSKIPRDWRPTMTAAY